VAAYAFRALCSQTENAPTVGKIREQLTSLIRQELFTDRGSHLRLKRSAAGLLMARFVVGTCLPGMALAQAPLAAATGEAKITEIIVTARKIEEKLQDVPMSVQALSGTFLDEADLTRLYDLQFNVPGLVVNNVGLFGARFTLRGIAAQGGSDQAVATHLNGVYLGNANLAIARTFDLERIEVLKGPQGTLYGRNATGGSMNFITRAPQDRFSADIEGAYGSFATKRVQGHVNVPIESAAVRLAFIASEGKGYIRNSVDDRRFAESDFGGVRASLNVDMSDSVRLSVMAQRVRDDGASGDLWTPNPQFLVDPSDIRLTTVTLANPYLVTENDDVNMTLDYELAFGTLRSITGYARNRTDNLDDCAGLPQLQGCVRGGPLRYDQWSEEIQLRLHSRGPIDGLVGIYYFDADETSDFHQFLPLVNPDPLSDDSMSRETAGAIFGQANLHFAERWSATGGLRLSREERRVSTISTGVEDSPTLLAGQYDSDDLSWRLDLEFAAGDDVMLYGGVSTGYKSGGFTPRPLGNELDGFGPEHLIAYEAGGKSQWLSRRLTLNAAAFYYDFEDLQVSTITLGGNRPGVDVANAAKAELYGIDAEGILEISDLLTVSGGVVWIPMREFVEFTEDQSGEMFSGNKLVRAPEWAASAAITYEQPLRDLGRLSARLEYSYRSSYFFTKENDPVFAQDGFALLNVLMRFESADNRWYAFASGRNLTNEDYFHQVFFQSSPGYPDTYEAGVGYRF
jgi:iron complex outermembrane recepter protein